MLLTLKDEKNYILIEIRTLPVPRQLLSVVTSLPYFHLIINN